MRSFEAYRLTRRVSTPDVFFVDSGLDGPQHVMSVSAHLFPDSGASGANMPRHQAPQATAAGTPTTPGAELAAVGPRQGVFSQMGAPHITSNQQSRTKNLR
jgi:hypothetical protein